MERDALIVIRLPYRRQTILNGIYVSPTIRFFPLISKKRVLQHPFHFTDFMGSTYTHVQRSTIISLMIELELVAAGYIQ
jgi:hypothetical protein